jgi:hypothetical protein
MKHVSIHAYEAENGRYSYELLDLSGGFAGSDGFRYATLGEAYEAGVDHVRSFPGAFALISPADVAALLKDTLEHLHTLRSYEDASLIAPQSRGLKELISKIEKTANT